MFEQKKEHTANFAEGEVDSESTAIHSSDSEPLTSSDKI